MLQTLPACEQAAQFFPGVLWCGRCWCMILYKPCPQTCKWTWLLRRKYRCWRRALHRIPTPHRCYRWSNQVNWNINSKPVTISTMNLSAGDNVLNYTVRVKNLDWQLKRILYKWESVLSLLVRCFLIESGNCRLERIIPRRALLMSSVLISQCRTVFNNNNKLDCVMSQT